MKALILAAGYGTRVYPLTIDQPKALLPVAGKPVINYLIEQIEQTSKMDQIYIVTNDKFYGQFDAWKREMGRQGKIEIISDGTTCNANRLGAVGDIALVLKLTGLSEDLLVAASDNIFCFSFARLCDFFEEKQTDCITVRELDDLAGLQKTGVAELDGDARVLRFEEKPQNPRSHLACPPVYVFKDATLPLFGEYLLGGGNPDAPGYFIQWLVHKRPVHALRFDEPRYNIGDLDSYRKVCQIFEGKAPHTPCGGLKDAS